jgi:HPt (histidine-containing phosphotransfer) domain-containing protein
MAELIEELAVDGQAQLAAMRDAVAAGDAAALARAAHTLKSTAASFGATALTERCRALEAAAREGTLTIAGVPLDELARDLADVLGVLSQWRPDDPDGA